MGTIVRRLPNYLRDPIKVDDRGSMNARELLGVHSFVEVGDGFAQPVTARAGMQVTIIFGGLQPLSLTPIQRLFKSSAHVHEYNARVQQPSAFGDRHRWIRRFLPPQICQSALISLGRFAASVLYFAGSTPAPEMPGTTCKKIEKVCHDLGLADHLIDRDSEQSRLPPPANSRQNADVLITGVLTQITAHRVLRCGPTRISRGET